MTYAPLTIEQVCEVAQAYEILDFLTEAQLQADLDLANKIANTPVSANALASAQWCNDHPRSVRTMTHCPREVVMYWYVQIADEMRMDDQDHARNEQWAYG
jgi:hypothetical protein